MCFYLWVSCDCKCKQDHFLEQHKSTDLWNSEVRCFLWGKDCVFTLLYLIKESGAYEIVILYLRLCSLITFELINRFLLSSVRRSCHCRWPRRHTSYHCSPKWRRFKRVRWMQNLHQATWDHVILYADRYSHDEQLLLTHFSEEKTTKNMNVERSLVQ